jgi:two-component system response regulator RegA
VVRRRGRFGEGVTISARDFQEPSPPSAPLPERPVKLLFIDDHELFVNTMSASLREFGHTAWAAPNFKEALLTIDLSKPDFVISELRVSGQFIFDFWPELDERLTPNRLAVATIYPSVATAVRLIRMGVAAYFTKPVSAATLLAELCRGMPAVPREPASESYGWPSLDRVIWEYLNQAYVAAGSMSEAARRLGLDRRSLRRMLAKYPPSR